LLLVGRPEDYFLPHKPMSCFRGPPCISHTYFPMVMSCVARTPPEAYGYPLRFFFLERSCSRAFWAWTPSFPPASADVFIGRYLWSDILARIFFSEFGRSGPVVFSPDLKGQTLFSMRPRVWPLFRLSTRFPPDIRFVFLSPPLPPMVLHRVVLCFYVILCNFFPPCMDVSSFAVSLDPCLFSHDFHLLRPPSVAPVFLPPPFPFSLFLLSPSRRPPNT